LLGRSRRKVIFGAKPNHFRQIAINLCKRVAITPKKENFMKKILFFSVLLSCSFLLAQDAAPAESGQRSDNSKGQVTITGCVSRSSGDYILMKQNPSITYELQPTGKIRLKNYLGQRVEVTGVKEPTLASSSDAMAKEGSAAPVTISIRSIKAIDKDCSDQPVTR
jgi:hypothetical protein